MSKDAPPPSQGNAGGPLAGVRVLDLTAVLLGPFATQILGDFGAEIVKVESPAGDRMRANGVSLNPGMSSIFLAVNRNKRSLCLDLGTKEGAAVLRRLIGQFDVFVHNMRVEAIERLGFGYEAVRAINPRIVYCAATGFDQDGPDAGKPAFDDIIQAASGMVALNGIGRAEPDYVPMLVADKTAGMAVVNAVLAALFHRERTGEGQYIEVPMLETLAGFVLAEHMGGLTFASSGKPAGYPRVMPGGRRPYATRDGHMAMLPYTADHWCAFFEKAGRPDLIEKFSVKDRQKLNANIRAVYDAVALLMRERATADWMALCIDCDIPATPIYPLDALPDHPQLKAVDLFRRMEHPSEGPVRYVRPATKFSATPASVRAHAPRLGEHTSEILRDAGFAASEIDALIANKIAIQNNNVG